MDELDDDLDYMNEEEPITTTQDIIDEPLNDESLITQLLKDRGIEDSSKIKFEDENGDIQEVDWNSLSNEDKLGILSYQETTETDLDDDEILLLNAIRSSKMSPREYLNYVGNQSVNNYLSNLNNTQPQYSVDNLSDETLFLSDILTRLGEDNVSDEELQNYLDQAQTNPELFKKQVDAIRQEYKRLEDNNRNQEQQYQQLLQIEQYNRFAESIENEIRSFTDFHGYDLNMDESEMEELYDFITGFDAAGVSIFGKVLNDPRTLVQMAWFALNSDEIMQNINDYWTNELKEVSKNSYNKGFEDAKNGKITLKSTVEIKPKNPDRQFDDFDDFDDIY